jgi:hypothetical protein
MDVALFQIGQGEFSFKPVRPEPVEGRIPDITKFALRKSIARALKIFHGLGWNWKI